MGLDLGFKKAMASDLDGIICEFGLTSLRRNKFVIGRLLRAERCVEYFIWQKKVRVHATKKSESFTLVKSLKSQELMQLKNYSSCS